MKSTRNQIFIIVSIVLSIVMFSCKHEEDYNYKNPDLSIEERVNDLLSKMTLKEKFWQLYMIPGDLSNGKEKYKYGLFGFQVNTRGKTGNESEQILDYTGGTEAKETAEKINRIQKYFIEETRLGIPIIPFDEALHGLIRKGATVFPQSIALAATWDTTLMKKVAKAIAMETKSRGIRQILSPVVNIARDVRWGRTEETYGEDPFLTMQMAVSYVSQFEKSGIITTPKHFVANVGGGGRDSYPIHYNDRLLEEIYFPAFKACIQKAGASSIMTAYNSLDGRPCTQNNRLLNRKLKKDWNFKGFVISDAGATGGANVLHYITKDYAESTKEAIEDGLDVILQTSYDHYPLFYEAFEKRMIDDEAVDNAVKRVLRAKFKLGLFENPYVDVSEIEKLNNQKENKYLAKRAALESIVLLKNKKHLLPVDRSIKSIAIIGVDAVEARLGGYSGPGNNPVSILQGVKNKIGKSVRINYSPGCGRHSETYNTVPANCLFHYEKGKKIRGLKGEYFNNITFEGQPVLRRIDDKIDFRWTLYSPDQKKVNYDFYSVRWKGKLIAPKTGNFEIGLKGDDGYRLFINGKLVIDNWHKQSFHQITKKYFFEKGKEYDLRVEFYETVGNVWLKMIWNVGVNSEWKQKIQKAIDIAKNSDIAIIVAGIEEGEFRDRAILSLPGHQEELINAVAVTGKPVVVVLAGGSAITMDSWIDNVSSIIDIWYPGEEGGNAVADVLFGDYNPAGRLPITFPVHEGQLPLYYNHKPTGRGDDYINLRGKPLFPFGFGLSYTTFKYHDFKIDNPDITTTDTAFIRFKLSNTGNYDGEEVVQLYIKDLFASVVRPVMELKGFQRLYLKKGETKQVEFMITPEMLSMYNDKMNKVVEPGKFRIMLGSSSNDIRLRAILKVKN